MSRYSIFSLAQNALSYHENWSRAWRSPEPKREYDAIIVGTGTRFGRMASQMANFLDQAGGLWAQANAYVNLSSLGLDRAAFQNLDAARAWRELDQIGGGNHVEFHQQIGEADVLCGLVHHDAHRALGRVRADVDHGAGEALVGHAGRGDQHLAVQVTTLRTGTLLQGFTRHLHGKRIAPSGRVWNGSRTGCIPRSQPCQ